MARGDPGQCVLEDRGVSRFDAEQFGGAQKAVGCGLAGKVLVAHGHTVDAAFDERRQAGHLQHFTGVGAGRHHCATQACRGSCLQISSRPFEHVDALLGQGLVEHGVLAVSQPVHGFGVGRVVRSALGSVMPRLARKARTPSSRRLPSTYCR